jgi:hypothetical protein
MKLHRDHLADLRKSGLNDETLLACRFQTVSAEELERLGSHYEDVVSAYRIPYWGLRGDKIDFARLKLFPPIKNADGHEQKYSQASGSRAYLYLPPLLNWQEIASNSSHPIIITEGEKKAAAGCQQGLAVIGIGGCWCWRTNNEDDGKVVLPDFDWFAWQDREVELCPDSDGWRPDKRIVILGGFFALGKELERRGAHVSMVRFPE